MLKRISSSVARLCTIVVLSVCPIHSIAQLSEISPGASTSGSPSGARFYVGATTGNVEYKNRFSSNDRLSVEARIAVESAHIGGTGQLFVLAEANGEFLMQVESGSFQAWDGNVSTLLARRAATSLLASESLTILSDLNLAPLGVAGLQLNIYLGYSVDSVPDTIHYSSSPFEIQIDEYDPLITATQNFQILDTVTVDENRERELPTLIYIPESIEPAAVILFSHGLGGTRFAATYLFQHFASRGYMVVSMQHPGSDSSIHEGLPASEILAAFNQAASADNMILRIGDVSSVIDQLEVWNADPVHTLYQRMDLERLGMSGHSFGARTTQTTSGEVVPYLSYSTLESRIDAAIPYSTSVASPEQAEDLLGEVNLPWLVMTGTNDISAVGNTTLEDRLAVFPALPVGDKYELVLFEAEHSAFTDNADPEGENYNPAHHPTITALSTAFWDTFLLGNLSARTWLEGEGAQSVLSEGDTWNFK